MLTKASSKSLLISQTQSIKSTRQKLELALNRLKTGSSILVPQGSKISATTVAKEAGVDRATLYRFHEPVLSDIRKINDSTSQALLKHSRSQLSSIEPKLKEYRMLVEQAQHEVTALARINYQLDAKVIELEESLKIKNEIINELQKQLNLYIKN